MVIPNNFQGENQLTNSLSLNKDFKGNNMFFQSESQRWKKYSIFWA